MSENSQLAIGHILVGTYVLERWLGQGGHGTIYQGRHLRTGGLVAIKLLRREAALDKQLLHRFVSEARIIAELRHPHIVQVLDCHHTEQDGPFMVMEFLEGETLQERLTQVGRLCYRRACTLAVQVGSALQAVHEAGIVHRDIKPANIFVTKRRLLGEAEDFFKVLDFGISKLRRAGSQTATSQILGTPHYMAPEAALQKNSEIDGRADQFSLAVVLYRALAGQVPFEGDEPIGVLHRVVYEEPEPLSVLAEDVPEAATDAVMRAMAKDPADRFPSVEMFLHAFCGTAVTAPLIESAMAEPLRAHPDSSKVSSRIRVGESTSHEKHGTPSSLRVRPAAPSGVDDASGPHLELAAAGPVVVRASSGGADTSQPSSHETPYSLAKGVKAADSAAERIETRGSISWTPIAAAGLAIGVLASLWFRTPKPVVREAARGLDMATAATAAASPGPPPSPAAVAPPRVDTAGPPAEAARPPLPATPLTPSQPPAAQPPAQSGPGTLDATAGMEKEAVITTPHPLVIRPPKEAGKPASPAGPTPAVSSPTALLNPFGHGRAGERSSSQCCVIKRENIIGLPDALSRAAGAYLASHRITVCGKQPVVAIQSNYDRDLVLKGQLPANTPSLPLKAFLAHLHGQLPVTEQLRGEIRIQCP